MYSFEKVFNTVSTLQHPWILYITIAFIVVVILYTFIRVELYDGAAFILSVICSLVISFIILSGIDYYTQDIIELENTPVTATYTGVFRQIVKNSKQQIISNRLYGIFQLTNGNTVVLRIPANIEIPKTVTIYYNKQ